MTTPARLYSEKERSTSGGLTAGELERRYQRVMDDLPMRVSCALDGCDWSGHEGTAAECRQAAADHRRDAHPGVRGRPARPRLPETPRRAPERKVAEEELREIANLIEAGATMTGIARDRNVRWGYKNERSATASLSLALHRLGLTTVPPKKTPEPPPATPKAGIPPAEGIPDLDANESVALAGSLNPDDPTIVLLSPNAFAEMLAGFLNENRKRYDAALSLTLHAIADTLHDLATLLDPTDPAGWTKTT